MFDVPSKREAMSVCNEQNIPLDKYNRAFDKRYRVYSFSYFKYGIYKPREVKKSDKETRANGIYKPREVKKSDKETRASHEFLYQIFFTSRGL